MAKVFQLNGILTSDVASEMDEGKYREKKRTFFVFFFLILRRENVR